MNDRNDSLDDFDDEELRGLAMAAFHGHELTVSPGETETALQAVRARIDAEDSGDASASMIRWDQQRSRRSPWPLLGAAAAVVALVAGGLVAVINRGDDEVVIPPATIPPVTSVDAEPDGVPATEPVPTTEPLDEAPTTETVPSSTDAAPATDPPATTEPVVAIDEPSVTDPPANDTGVSTEGAIAIPDNCIGDFNCTDLASTEDGRIVAYDPTAETLSLYDATGQELQSVVPLAEPIADRSPYFVHIGPDDVAYMSVMEIGAIDPNGDLVAIPLVGSNAGSVVEEWIGGGDYVGDSTFVPRKAGIAVQGCCGFEDVRPDPDAPLYRYVDRNGSLIESTAPTFRLDLGDVGNNLARINEDGSSTFWSLPAVLQSPRDFPLVAATDDGGALVSEYSQVLQRAYIVKFGPDWPDFGIANADVYLLDERAGLGAVLLEPSGTVLLRDENGSFVRRELDEIGTPGWPATSTASITDGTVTAEGLNEYIDTNQPGWAADGVTFGFQFEQSVGPNEVVRVEFDEATGVVTITTSGLLDDSVTAVQRVIQTERADDGLLRFVSGTYGQQCAPGRGHQDFNTDPCT